MNAMEGFPDEIFIDHWNSIDEQSEIKQTVHGFGAMRAISSSNKDSHKSVDLCITLMVSPNSEAKRDQGVFSSRNIPAGICKRRNCFFSSHTDCRDAKPDIASWTHHNDVYGDVLVRKKQISHKFGTVLREIVRTRFRRWFEANGRLTSAGKLPSPTSSSKSCGSRS